MELLKIGAIANTHGLKGTLKVKSFTDFKEERFKKGNQLFIRYKGEDIAVTVENCRSTKGLEHINFKEFNDINEVEKYKKCELFISKEMVHELQEDEFYFNELIGLKVYTDVLMGTCIDVLEVPQGELLVVGVEGKKNVLIPFQKEFVESVSVKDDRIVIKAWEGLF